MEQAGVGAIASVALVFPSAKNCLYAPLGWVIILSVSPLWNVAVKMPRVKAAPGGRPGPAKRHLAVHFTAGEILTDMTKKEWKLGLPIGQGGFGCIYLGKGTTAVCRY